MTANILAKKIRSQRCTSDYKAGMAALKKLLAHPSATSDRTCVYCGCTDSHACRSGCLWVIVFQHGNAGVCSNCTGPHAPVAAVAAPRQSAANPITAHPGTHEVSPLETVRALADGRIHTSHSSHKSHSAL